MLKNKNAVIYGGSGAIGGAVARVFAREGARVFIAGRTRAKLDTVARDIVASGGMVETAEVDTLDEQAVKEHAAAVAQNAGGIDITLNAVSFMHDQGTPLVELQLDAFMLPIDRFLRSLFITTKAVAPHMGKKQSSVILTLAPGPAATMAAAGHLGHCISCAGVEAFSRVLAAEWAPNVRVVCLRSHAIADAPAAGSYTGPLFEPKTTAAGITVNEWLAGAARGTMLQRLPTLAEVAETAAFLASDRASAMTATVTNLTCGAIPE